MKTGNFLVIDGEDIFLADELSEQDWEDSDNKIIKVISIGTLRYHKYENHWEDIKSWEDKK